MPAPAPWARTKQARACGGISSRPETRWASSTSMVTGCAVDGLIELDTSWSGRAYLGRGSMHKALAIQRCSEKGY